MESSKCLVCVTSIFWQQACPTSTACSSYHCLVIYGSQSFPFCWAWQVVARYGWLLMQLSALGQLLRRDAHCQLKRSRSSCECCSLQCIILCHVASVYLLEWKHFIYLNVGEFGFLQGRTAWKGLNPLNSVNLCVNTHSSSWELPGLAKWFCFCCSSWRSCRKASKLECLS